MLAVFFGTKAFEMSKQNEERQFTYKKQQFVVQRQVTI